jgi:hypothetical protein
MIFRDLPSDLWHLVLLYVLETDESVKGRVLQRAQPSWSYPGQVYLVLGDDVIRFKPHADGWWCAFHSSPYEINSECCRISLLETDLLPAPMWNKFQEVLQLWVISTDIIVAYN